MLTDKITQIEDIDPDPDLTNTEQSASEDTNSDYQFADGYIDPDDKLEEFLEEFRKPKQETGAPEQPDENEDDPLENEDPIANENARYTAEFIVNVVDDLAANGLSILSKNPIDDHRAGKDQKKHLKRLWTEYCKEKAIDIPVGTQIVIAMATIYGSQIPAALNDRKSNLKLEQIKEEEQRLSYDRHLLEQEKKQFEYRRKAQKDGE